MESSQLAKRSGALESGNEESGDRKLADRINRLGKLSG